MIDPARQTQSPRDAGLRPYRHVRRCGCSPVMKGGEVGPAWKTHTWKRTYVSPIRKRRMLRDMALVARLKAAADRADAGIEGTDVSDMTSEEFIAFLRR